MEESTYSYLDRPQRLCKMCGKCCVLAMPQYDMDDIVYSTCDEQSEAKDFLDVFEEYESMDTPRRLCPEFVDKVIEELKSQNRYEEDKTQFCHCRYILPDNRCGRYLNRPELCKRTPRNGWTMMPTGCGFKGWQFALREEIKHTVRALKEYLYECEIIYGDKVIPEENKTPQELKKLLEEKFKPYERFGVQYW